MVGLCFCLFRLFFAKLWKIVSMEIRGGSLGKNAPVCLEYDEPKFRTKNCIGIVTPHICSHSFVHSLPMSLSEDLRE